MRYDEVAPFSGDPDRCHDCGGMVWEREIHDKFHLFLLAGGRQVVPSKHDRDDDFPRGKS